MRLPSVRTIREILRVDVGTAARVRTALEVGRDSCVAFDVAVEFALKKCDAILGGHGVGRMRSRQDTMREFLGVGYVNVGDPYIATVYFDHATGQFHCGAWGDLVAAHDHRFGESS